MKWLVPSLTSALIAVSFSQAFAASPGQPQWTVKRSLQKDNFQRYYFTPAYPDFKLSRVNKSNGSARWSKTLPEFAYFDTTCADADRLFVYAGKKLQAINPENGQTLWTYTHEGSETYTNLSRLPRSNEVFISYGENSSSIKAINKYSGQKTWDYTAGPYAYLFNSDWQNYYISQYQNGQGKIIALNHWNGSYHWTRDIAVGGFWTVDTQGRVFLTGGSAKIEKLAPWNGSVAWTYQGEGDYAYLEFNDAGLIYAHDAKKLARLNPDSGAIQWSQSLVPPANAYVATIPLKSGEVIIRTTYSDQNKAKNKFLNKDGSKRWENWSNTLNGYVSEDAAQQLYGMEGKRVVAYDRNTGATRWTYNFQGDANQNIFQVYGEGEGLYATYGTYGKYPPMGLIRLSGSNGSQYWKTFLNKTFSVIGWDDQRVLTSSYLTGESSALQR